jgi:pyrroloquinoline quinone biosynthesis protein B
MSNSKSFLTYLLFLALLTPFSWSQKVIVLGNLQDGGSPQYGCQLNCCSVPQPNEYVSSLGIYNDTSAYLIDATPDLVIQAQHLERVARSPIKGIFLTHAHMGHYTGLIHLGREAANTRKTEVFAMPRMSEFLTNNGPWDQLIALENIQLTLLTANKQLLVDQSINITPLLVPHRDEYSETVGFLISGRRRKLLYIPDIDKWGVWNHSLKLLLKEVDFALIDGTFLKDGEINRPMSEIPHPFITETASLLASLKTEEKNKVWFTHFNHTNPARFAFNKDRIELEAEGYHFASFGTEFNLED